MNPGLISAAGSRRGFTTPPWRAPLQRRGIGTPSAACSRRCSTTCIHAGESTQGENAISTARSSVSSAEPLRSPNALASKSMTYVTARLLDLGRHFPVPHGNSDSIRVSLLNIQTLGVRPASTSANTAVSTLPPHKTTPARLPRSPARSCMSAARGAAPAPSARLWVAR